MYFSFDFDWYSIHLDIVHKNRGEGCGDSLNGQNPLSMRKVICQQSLRAREILRFSVTFFNCQNSERENKERKVKT